MDLETLVVGAAGLMAVAVGWRACTSATRAPGAGFLVLGCALLVVADLCDGIGHAGALAATLRVIGAAAAASVAVRAVTLEPASRRSELVLDAVAATVATAAILAAPLGPDLGTLDVSRLAATIAATVCLVGALLSCGTGGVRQPTAGLLVGAVLAIGALEALAATDHRVVLAAPVGYALLVAAARAPQREGVLPPGSRGSELSRVVLVGAALGVPVWVAAIRPDTVSVIATATLMVAAMTVVVLVCCRLALTGRDRAVARDELAHRAAHDELTGLANRPLLADRLQHALNRAQRGGGTVSVLTVDLDRFKAVNDTWGHAAGDAVLLEVAARLNALVQPGDTVARVGGDEFVVVCEELENVEDAIAIAERIVEAFGEAILASQHVVTVSVCIGVAVHRGDGSTSTPESLLRDAEAAMFLAKQDGPNCWELYDADLRESVQRRRDTEAALQGALDRAELRLVYQPVVRLRTNEITGFEALVRWARPDHGIVGPDDFIGLAEETNLIVEIGEWVLEQACRQVAIWNSQHPDRAPLSISVNVSARQLDAPGFTDSLQRVIFRTNVDPQSLLLEITESVLVRNADYVLGQLEGAKRLGVRLAVDDFGTGYSALAYLRQFPIDLVKIDKVFMAELGTLAPDSTVIAAVIRLAQALGQEVIAEGAETEQQKRALAELGCDYVQGYYFAPPLAQAQAELLVRGRRDLTSVQAALQI
ncbi:MAG: putative bifunctional diguanylate cyclase/phosphodiesterase [Actinomycetota bacterium]